MSERKFKTKELSPTKQWIGNSGIACAESPKLTWLILTTRSGISGNLSLGTNLTLYHSDQ